MNIQQAIQQAGQQIPSSEAEILLAFVLKKDKIFLYKNPDYKLTTNDQQQFARFVTRRIAGEPIAYITNHQEFFGLDFYVDKNVLIPRPETEILIESVFQEFRSNLYLKSLSQISIVDVGTGSGAIAVALAKKLKIENCKLKIYGIDISKKALKIAKKNAKKHQVENKISFLQGNLLAPLPEKVDLIVANLPYVATEFQKYPNFDDINNFEPKMAFFGGDDGLDLIKKLLKQAPKYLNKNGLIFLEISPEQKTTLQNFILEKLLPLRGKFKKDLQGLYRILIIKI